MNFKLFNIPSKILLIQFFLTLNLFSCQADSIIPMKDYINKTKNEFSYQIIDSFKTGNWKSYHVKMISGEWLNKKFVDYLKKKDKLVFSCTCDNMLRYNFMKKFNLDGIVSNIIISISMILFYVII